MPPLLLTRTDLRAAVDVGTVTTELRTAMTAYRGDSDAHRVTVALDRMSVTVLAVGRAAGVPAFTVKVQSKHPDRRPAIEGLVCLHDHESGSLLAVMDSAWLTALRTGAGGALGADVLARPEATVVGVIGAGAQGEAQARALAALRQVDAVLVHDLDRAQAERFAGAAQPWLAAPVTVVPSSDEVLAGSDIVLVATWSRRPVVTSAAVRPGTHVTSLGADEPGKQEVEDRLHATSLTVVDDRDLAAPVIGDAADATLAEVLRGQHPGRRRSTETTIYSPVGLPMQDCVVAWHAYQRALVLGLGTEVDLGGDALA